jgi:hypothetical protein
VIATGIGTLRPGAEVTTVELARLEGELARLDPEVVVCSRPEPAGLGVRRAWIELSLNPTRPARISLGGCRSESTNTTLETLLTVIDDVDGLLRSRGFREGRVL